MVAVLGEHAHAGGNLEASYTISFARIRVGDITATVVMDDSEYAISVRGRAGGIIKLLIDGEGSFNDVHLQDRVQRRNFRCDDGA